MDQTLFEPLTIADKYVRTILKHKLTNDLSEVNGARMSFVLPDPMQPLSSCMSLITAQGDAVGMMMWPLWASSWIFQNQYLGKIFILKIILCSVQRYHKSH